uniref:CSON000469 protein n=1 Tax=Culicoides sonorensis TaxID=179676 RepID=A0A336KAA5_CULSO
MLVEVKIYIVTFAYFRQSIRLLVFIFACICLASSEDDVTNKRTGLLQRRNIGGRPNIILKTTTTTTVRPHLEDDYADEEYEEEYQAPEKQEESETTTTEQPKRITLAVRPFRSNDDLLNALKKRRLQAKSQQQQQPKTVTQKYVDDEKPDEEEKGNTKSQPKLKSSKSVPALKKRQFGGVKSNDKVPVKAKESHLVIEEPAPSAFSPLTERAGRSRFTLNRSPR